MSIETEIALRQKNDLALILRAFDVFNGFDGPDNGDLWWRTDEEYKPVALIVNCNDVFVWGFSDCEEITYENIEVLESSFADLKARGDFGSYAGILFCSRIRRMRPQGAFYKSLSKEVWPLFDACGPHRPAALGNPEATPEAQYEANPVGAPE